MTKINLFLLVSMVFIIVINVNAIEKSEKSDIFLKIEKVENINNGFKWGRFYFSGQPTLENLRWYSQQGVAKIINLRSKKETDLFTKSAFDEVKIIIELNMDHVSIPVGSIDDYTSDKLNLFISEIENCDKPILIHCASATRVTYFMMAYLIKEKNFTRNQAEQFGKQLKLNSYLDLLLR